MAKNKKKENPVPEDVQEETEAVPEQEVQEDAEAPEAAEASEKDQLLAEAADKYLRLAAECSI